MVANFKSSSSRGFFLAIVIIMILVPLGIIGAIVVLQQASARQINSQVQKDYLHQSSNDAFALASSKIGSGSVPLGGEILSANTETCSYTVRAYALEDIPGPIGKKLVNLDGLAGSVYLQIVTRKLDPNAPSPRASTTTVIVRVADAGKYFLASKTSFGLAQQFNSSQAKIYARDIGIRANLGVIPAQKPSVKKIYYFNRATSFDVSQPYPFAPQEEFPSSPLSDRFLTSNSNPLEIGGKVVKLEREPIFPELTPDNMIVYKAMAQAVPGGNAYFNGNATLPDDILEANWRDGDHIYPPGCRDATCSNLITNADHFNHVYFIEGDLHIRGVVHGQVLFVARGTIFIDGDLISNSLGTGDFPVTQYPGCASNNSAIPPLPCRENKSLNIGSGQFPNASNAHQAAFVTPSVVGIKINNEALAANLNTTGFGTAGTLDLEAFLITPNGGYMVTAPAAGQINYIFTGAKIMRNPPNEAGKLVPPLAVPENEIYMSSLGSRPIPFLPGYTQTLVRSEQYFD